MESVSVKSLDTFGDMLKTTEGLNLEIIQGEVFMVYPGLGVYLVLPKHGDATASLVVCCSMQGSIGRSGVQGGDTYEAGDDILVARQRDVASISLNGKVLSDVGYILCAAPPDFMATAQGHPGANIHGETLDYFSQTVTEAFANTKQLANTMRDISYGMPNDVFAGDFVKYGPLFTFFSVCATKTTIGASPMAMVEAFAFHDKVRITARSFEERGTSVESGREPDANAMYYYKRLAFREREGFGAVGSVAPFMYDDAGDIEQADEAQLGVFRHTGIIGEMGDGEIDALLAPVEEDEIHTTDGKPPVGKVSVRKTYDGRHETRAVGGIDHVKSLFIPVPEQTKPLDADASDETSPEKPYDEENRSDLGDGGFAPFAATLEADEFDQDTEKFRNMRIPKRSEYFRVMSRDGLKEQYPELDVDTAPREMEALDKGDPFYDEPPHVDDIDPVTELTRRLYALESIIRQQPDGSIIISDGHGSEILMHRGRISISPAADLELRPGRDCIELVPRRKVINAGEELQLVSNEGKIRIKAETDIDVLAGNGGTGRVLVENRAVAGVEEDPGGVVIRSAADFRMLGANVYLGIIPPKTDAASTSMSGLSRDVGGSVIIDSRGGSIGLHGNRMYGRFDSGVSLSSGNALMSAASGIFTVIANATQFATGPFTIGRLEEGSVSQVVLDEHGVSEETIESAAFSYLKIAGSIAADGAVLSGILAAASVSASSGAFGNASLSSGMYSEGLEPPEVNVEPFSAEYLGIMSEAYGDSVPDDLTDEKILEPWFEYDKPEDVDQTKFLMYEMRWQAMLGAGGASIMWDPKAVKSSDDEDTYAYPGYGTDGDVLQDSKFAKKPMDEYIVNK